MSEYKTKKGVTGAMLDMMPQVIDKLFPLTLTITKVNGNIEVGQSVTPQASFVVKDKDGVDVTAQSTITVVGATVNMTTKKWTADSSISATKSYTTKAVYNGQEKTASTQWLVGDYVYYGAVSTLSITETEIKKLTKAISTEHTRDIKANEGQYVVYCIPKSNIPSGKTLKITDSQNNDYESQTGTNSTLVFSRQDGSTVEYYCIYTNQKSGATWTFKIVEA